MKVAGFEIEDVHGNGVQGLIPLTGLTLLFGKNASGKTTFLENLMSLLDPKTDWLGRRARIGDESFAYGQLFLSGSWDGDDWQWLRILRSAPTSRRTAS